MGSLAVVVPFSAPPDPQAAQRMLAAAPHRGTDLDVRVCENAVLGVSSTPGRPDAWIASRNGLTAALAGSLDNAAELREELRRAGVDLSEDDPASPLAAAFDAWGERTAERLRGPFTAAVSDGSKVWCVRDQLGLRPLFYGQDEHAFVAATEPKQVVAGAGASREPDLEAVESMFYGQFDMRKTMLKGVDRFPRATASTVDREGRVSFAGYWDPSRLLETARLSVSDVVERLPHFLDQAVSRCLSGNDAISLSGGVDSPTLAAFAAPRHLELSGRPLLALSRVYPDLPRVDERPYIEMVVEHLGLPLHAYVPQARPLDDLGLWVDICDGPVDTLSIPGVAENYRRAKEIGADTVLMGDRAELVFAFGHHVLGHFLLHGRWRALARWLRRQRSGGASWRWIARALAPSITPAFIATPYVRLRKRDTAPGLPPWADPLWNGKEQRSNYRPDLARPARRRWLEHQLDPLRGVGAYTLDADAICAEYCGMRVRRPFADVDLWEFFLSLRAETKFPDAVSKSLVRQTMRGRLPDAILDRRDKTAFNDHALATADYAALRRWILGSSHQIRGVDYRLLATRLEQQDMEVFELMWAYDLARVHAFLSLWD